MQVYTTIIFSFFLSNGGGYSMVVCVCVCAYAEDHTAFN